MSYFIEYFYGIIVDKILYHDKCYSFNYDGYLYKLYEVENDLDINNLVKINKILLNHTLMSEIIINKHGLYVSNYNKKNYILIKLFINIEKKISLEEISYLANSLYINNLSINWAILWGKKIDYLEELINENGKKYPLLVDSFNYFVGMAENAITYYNNIITENCSYCVSL